MLLSLHSLLPHSLLTSSSPADLQPLPCLLCRHFTFMQVCVPGATTKWLQSPTLHIPQHCLFTTTSQLTVFPTPIPAYPSPVPLSSIYLPLFPLPPMPVQILPLYLHLYRPGSSSFTQCSSLLTPHLITTPAFYPLLSYPMVLIPTPLLPPLFAGVKEEPRGEVEHLTTAAACVSGMCSAPIPADPPLLFISCV